MVKALAGLGQTAEQIASLFGVDRRTISRWRNRHPAFRKAMDLGNAKADAVVEDALYRRAMGYTYTEETVTIEKGQMVGSQHVRVREITRWKHVPPDVKCIIRWLCNRRPDRWKRLPREHGYRQAGNTSKPSRSAA
jgi:hypothetical protein